MTPTTAAVMPDERRRQRPVAAQPLHVRRAEEHEQEARHEGHPGDQQRGERRRRPTGRARRVAVGAEERHELHDHDQRSGRGLGQGQAAHHLPRRQPAVDLHRLLGDVGEHGVRPAEGHDRGAGEEQPLLGEHAVPSGQQRHGGDRHAPDQRARPAAPVGCRRPEGRSVCSASSGITGGGPSSPASALPPCGTAPGRHRPSAHPARPAASDHDRERDGEQEQRQERGDGQGHQRGAGQRAPADPDHGLDDDGEHRGREPGEQRASPRRWSRSAT